MKKFQIDTDNTLLTGLKAYYKLGDVSDFWGSYILSATNVDFGDSYGKIGPGAHFNGSSASYLESSSNLGITGNASWSMVIWTKDNTPISGGNLISIGTASDKNLCGLLNSGTGATYLFLNFWSGGDNYEWDTGIDLSSGMHQIIITYDGSSVRVYVDNSLSVTRTLTLNISDAPVRIGGRTGGYAGQYSNSNIDEAGIWSKVLSSQERADLYNGGNGQTMMLLLPQILEF